MIPKIWKRAGNNQYYVTIAGKQHALGTNLKAAKDKRAELLDATEGVVRTQGGPILFRALVDKYLKWMESNKAPSTYIVAEGLLEKLKAATPAKLKAIELTPTHVQDWLDKASAKSPSTINGRITLVSGMFNWGRRNKLVHRNPIADMPRPTPRIRQEFIPPDKFAEILAACPNEPLRDFIAFMLDTGCRAEEMFKFRVEHVDPKGDKIVLPMDESKGRKRSRTTYLPPAAQEIVKRAMAGVDSGALFRNTRGAPWTRSSINDSMRRLRERIGIPKLCATTLRHSFAHARLTAGQSTLVVSKLMGHVNTKMLETRYGHIEESAWLAGQAQSLELVKVAETKE